MAPSGDDRSPPPDGVDDADCAGEVDDPSPPGDQLTLAVATNAETYERLRGPLGDRGIRARAIRYRERTFDLAAPPFDADTADVGLVFPGRIMEGGVVDALLDVPWVNDRESILRSRNKAGALARLQRAGVPTPDTVVVSNPAEEDAVADAFDRIGAPVVVKPNSATRGIGVARIGDLDSFLGVVDYLDLVQEIPSTADRTYLVQEFLPDARDYRAMVVDGEYAGAVERQSPAGANTDEHQSSADAGAGERRVSGGASGPGRWKHNVHRGARATGVDLPPELRELAERAADALDLSYLGVDLLVTDDRAVVNETNARPTVDDASKYEPDFFDRLAALIRRTAGA